MCGVANSRLGVAQADVFQYDLAQHARVAEALQCVENFDSRQATALIIVGGNAIGQLLSSYCGVDKLDVETVSYTHLDVYKRQVEHLPPTQAVLAAGAVRSAFLGAVARGAAEFTKTP